MRYQGDDLINLMRISVTPEEGKELPEIEAVDVQVGCITKHYDHPDNPFFVHLFREDSIRLSDVNPCYAAIYYWDTVDGVRKLIKHTCEGTVNLDTKQEVVNGGCKC